MSIKNTIAAGGLFAIASAVQGQPAYAETIDSAKNLRIVSAALDDACVSNKSRAVESCTATVMNSTLGVAHALESYLDRHYPGHGASRILARDCENNFNAIAAKYERDANTLGIESALPDYFRNGFLGSRKCLETIEGVSAQFNLTYMPSTVSLLHRKINDAESGKIAGGWHI